MGVHAFVSCFRAIAELYRAGVRFLCGFGAV